MSKVLARKYDEFDADHRPKAPRLKGVSTRPAPTMTESPQEEVEGGRVLEPTLLDYGCTHWRRSSQRAADSYDQGIRLWSREDLANIEQQLAQSRTAAHFTVRRTDGSVVHIKNPMFGVQRPIWYDLATSIYDSATRTEMFINGKQRPGSHMSSSKSIGTKFEHHPMAHLRHTSAPISWTGPTRRCRTTKGRSRACDCCSKTARNDGTQARPATPSCHSFVNS